MMDKNILTEQLTLREQYMLFLKLIGLSSKSIVNYASDIDRCSELIKDILERDGFSSIYDIDSQDIIRHYQQKLVTNSRFITQNNKCNHRLSACIYNYVKFVDFLFVFSKKKK